jgi:glucose/arabinose dehydrogenase
MLAKRSKLKAATLTGSPHSCGYADGLLSEAKFNSPTGIAVNDDGVVIVSDSENHRLRRISLQNELVETIAGCGQEGSVDGPALEALLFKPSGICFGLDDSIVWVDEAGSSLRVLKDEMVSTRIGKNGSGYQDGPEDKAKLRSPRGMAHAEDGTIFIADNGNHRIRRVDPAGIVSTIGTGESSCQDGPLNVCSFLYPSSVCVLPSGILYVGELYRVRKVSFTDNHASTFEKTSDTSLTSAIIPSPVFDMPGSEDGNKLFYSDSNGSKIMWVNEKGNVKTFSGASRQGNHADGALKDARYTSPRGLAFTPDGDLLICDSTHCIRIIRDAYPRMERAIHSTSRQGFSLEALLECDSLASSQGSHISLSSATAGSTDSSTPRDCKIPFHSSLALLAYPSLFDLSDEEISKLSSLSYPMDKLIKMLYVEQGGVNHTEIQLILSFLYMVRVFRLPVELEPIMLNHLAILVRRSRMTKEGIVDLLATIGSEFDGILKSASERLVASLKILSDANTIKATINRVVAPKNQAFAEELISHVDNPAVTVANLNAATSKTSGAISSMSSTQSASSSSPNRKTKPSQPTPASLQLPYLMSQCDSLFWAKVCPSSTSEQTLSNLGSIGNIQRSQFSSSNPSAAKIDRLESNFTIGTDESEPFKVHDWILYARWGWFRNLMKSGMGERSLSHASLPSDTLSRPTLFALLHYLYSHRTDLFNSAQSCKEILEFADLFQITEFLSKPTKASPGFETLVSHCQQYLFSHSDPNENNAIENLKFALEYGSKSHASSARYYIATHIVQIMNNPKQYAALMSMDAQVVKDIFGLIDWKTFSQPSK